MVPSGSSSGFTRKRFSQDVKLVAARGREAGMTGKEISRLVGASAGSVDKWWRAYREGGAEGLIRRSSRPNDRKLCAADFFNVARQFFGGLSRVGRSVFVENDRCHLNFVGRIDEDKIGLGENAEREPGD